jgi:uncharacterized protein
LTPILPDSLSKSMPYLEKYLYVNKSTIPEAGKGLFTKIGIEKGTRVLEYKGKLQRWVDVKGEEENGSNGYLLRVNYRKAINAKNHLKALGRYVNDARGPSKLVGVKNNCEFVSDGDRCFVESLRHIARFEEILVGYGKEYWVLMKKLKNANGPNPLKRKPAKEKIEKLSL